jgi:hypothetical protein
MALCPAAHTLRFSVSGSVLPESTAGIQSQCSTKLNAASKTLRVHAAQAEDFAPEPLAGVNAAAFGHDVRPHLAAELRDLRRLGMAGVVFPQPDHRVEVVLPFWQQTERRAVLVHGNGRAARRVDADADDLRGIKPGHFGLCLLQRAFHDAFEAVEVVLRILPRHMRVTRIEQDAHLTTGVVEHGRADLRAVVEVDEKRAAGVRAVVDAEGVALHGLGKSAGVLAESSRKASQNRTRFVISKCLILMQEGERQ